MPRPPCGCAGAIGRYGVGWPRRASGCDCGSPAAGSRSRQGCWPQFLGRETSAAVSVVGAERAGRAITAGAIPGAVTTLVREVLRGMLMARIKIAAMTALAAGIMAIVAAGVVGVGANGNATQPPNVRNDAERPEPEPAAKVEDAGDQVTYIGRVLDPRGKPFMGAMLSLSHRPSRDPYGPTVRATSDADGQFRFNVPKAAFDPHYADEPWKEFGVVAKAKGYGLGIGKHRQGDESVTLQLAEDLPINGRIVDLQGRPLPGITILPRTLRGTVRGDLDPLLAVYVDPKTAAESPARDRIFVDIAGNLPPIVTGLDGRFRLEGLGRERLVAAMIEGPGIETAWIEIMTRRAATIRATQPGGRPLTIYGAEFEHVAGPSQPIIGVVRDADTGAPVEGVEIQANYPAGFVNYIKSLTDEAGRYRLDGLPAGGKAYLTTVAPKGRPYLQAMRQVRNDLALQPTEAAFTLKRGVWLTGRVTERATGRPVRAQVNYFVFTDNPHAAEARDFSGGPELKWTAPDGAYRVAGLPGRGIIAVKAHAREDYCVGLGADNIRGSDSGGWFHTRPHYCIALNYNGLAEVNPAEDATEIGCDLTVDAGRSVKVTVLDPDGVPLAGALVLGRTKGGSGWPLVPLKTAEFEVVRLAAGEARTLTILHDDRKLAAGLVVRGDAPDPASGPVTVRLQPWGVITGRLVDDHGEPRSDVEIHGMDRPRYDPVDGGVAPAVAVGEDGRFRIEGLVPGRRYKFGVVRRRYGLGTIVEDLAVAPGETRDLGDVKAKSE